MVDEQIVIKTIDEFLAELGTTGLVDARKARDQLMDLRLMLMKGIQVPDTIESISPNEEIL
jgi:hypothetical protein